MERTAENKRPKQISPGADKPYKSRRREVSIMSYEDYVRQLDEAGFGDEQMERLNRQEAVHQGRLRVDDEATRRLLAAAGQGGSY
jgi:anti-sigma28 factor (negative regulator of flagellin synthesis)